MVLISPRTGSAIAFLTQEDDDRARSKASDITDVVLALAEEGDLTAALDTAIQAVNLMSDIRFTSWSTRYIAESCMYVHQLATNFKKPSRNKNSAKNSRSSDSNSGDYDYDIANKYLRRAHEMNVLLQGARSPDSRRTAEMIKIID